MKSLKNCENIFGKIRPTIAKRIKNYITEPTVDSWSDISTIIIKPEGMKTIWNAMIEYDSTFPKSGRVTDEQENIVREWERIPQPFELLKAIRKMTI